MHQGAQLSSSSLQKILTEQGVPEIDPSRLGPRNGNDAAGPTGHYRDLQPSAEPQDELPRDRQVFVARVTVASNGDTAILHGELPGVLPGREGHGDPAAAPRRKPIDERVGNEHLGPRRGRRRPQFPSPLLWSR